MKKKIYIYYFTLKYTKFVYRKLGMFSDKDIGNMINGVPGRKKMTIWFNYRFTFEQKGIFYSIYLNFVKI